MSLFLRTRCFKNLTRTKNINALVKCFSSGPSEPGSQDPSVLSFNPVFQFPYIRLAALITRSNYFQTISSTLVVCSSTMLSLDNTIDPATSVTVSAVGICFGAFFHILGSLVNNMIGIVYIDEKEEFVRFSYLDFWGRRQDAIVPLKKIVPICENSPGIMEGLYSKVICRTLVPHTYKIYYRLGGIIDNQKFQKIFMID